MVVLSKDSSIIHHFWPNAFMEWKKDLFFLAEMLEGMGALIWREENVETEGNILQLTTFPL